MREYQEENVPLLNKRKRSFCCRHFGDRCVCTKGVLLLLFWSAIIESFGYYLFFRALGNIGIKVDWSAPIFVRLVKSTSYLLYPVAGLIAEVYWSRYKIMITGTVLAFIGIIIATPSLALTIMYSNATNSADCTIMTVLSDTHNCTGLYYVVPGAIGMGIYQIGLGLFEANVIQFGSDQLLFASSDRLSDFVSWYFWSMYILDLIVYYACDFMYYPLLYKVHLTTHLIILIILIAIMVLSILLFVSFFILWYLWRLHLTNDPVSHINPVKHIYRVLKFVKSHDQPLLRSALTYSEIPTRMDYAKQRYGGPFTTEQVEDVKTFGRISLVILTLFGSLLLLQSNSNNNYSSLYLDHLIIVVAIPIHMLFIRSRSCMRQWTNNITILQKIGFGLFLAFLQNCLMILYSSHPSLALIALATVLYGFSLLFVFLSTLQFILAQAPRNMQGFLIGLWYAYWSVSIIFYSLLKYSLEDHRKFYYICSAALSLVSLTLFAVVSFKYRYRQREERVDVNHQSIIEEYTERRLLRRNIQQQQQQQQELDNNTDDTFEVNLIK